MQLYRDILRNWSAPDAAEFDLLRLPSVRYLVVIVYVFIIVVGTLGNGLVVFVAACGRTARPPPLSARGSQTATNVFVLTLAVSDLALCVFSLPVQLHYQITDRWYFGSALCRVIFAALAVPMYLSMVTILLIAVDRYLLVVRPFSARLSACRAVGLVSTNVAVSLLLAAPVVHYTTLKVIDHDPRLGVDGMQLCIEDWSNITVRRVYTVSTFTVQFFLPLLLTAGLYTRIYASLRHRRRNRPQRISDRSYRNQLSYRPTIALAVQHPAYVTWWSRFVRPAASRPTPDIVTSAADGLPRQAGSENDGSDGDARRCAGDAPDDNATAVEYRSNLGASLRRRRAGKTNRILTAIVVNFIVCWLPWNVFGLITEFDYRSVSGRHFKLVDLVLKGFAMSSACINPLLYCWLNETLRRDLASVAIRLRIYRPVNGTTAAATPGISRLGVGRSQPPMRRSVPPVPGDRSPAIARHQQRSGRGQLDLPRFDVQPPSFCVEGASGECLGLESVFEDTSTGSRVAPVGRRLLAEPRKRNSCYLSSVSCPPGTMSVTLERSSISSGGGSGYHSSENIIFPKRCGEPHKLTSESVL